MSRRARRMEAAAPHSPAEKEAARRAAEKDAAERARARADFKANQEAQARIRGYQRILNQLDRREKRRRAKVERDIQAAQRMIDRRNGK